jgi:hypothetical protein
MKRVLSLLTAALMLSSFTGCCLHGGGGCNQGSYYQPYNYGAGACPGGACGVPQQAPLYPSGSLYGPTTSAPASAGPVASYPYVPQTAFVPMQTFPAF